MAAAPRSAPWRAAFGVVAALGVVAGGGLAARAGSGGALAPEPTVWLFFAPADGDLSADVKALGEILARQPGVRFRPCLLSSDLGPLATPSGEFAATVGAVRRLQAAISSGLDPGLRILDDEGLVAARRLGVEALPAWVHVAASGRAHVAAGRGANLRGLLSCK